MAEQNDMEPLAGVSLEQWLAREAATRERLDPLAIGHQLAEALLALHRQGLVHGGLYPGAVTLRGGAAGWQAVLLPAAPQAAPPEYLAPELIAQIAGGPASEKGPAVDVYALGCLVRALLRANGDALDTPATFPAARQGDPALAKDVPELVQGMLAQDPAQRPAMEQVAAELLRLGQPKRGDPGPDLPVGTGQCIGSYRLLRQLGSGGMGVVFLAAHTRLSRQAAIKVLRPELSQHPDMVTRFFTEAEAVNIVAHPGIVSIYEFGQLPDRTAFIVMEYLAGETLQQRLQHAGGKLGTSALRLLRQIASALAAAHARGIVHRDLKPENVMIVADPDVPGGERAKLLDFGIAKMAEQLRKSGMDLQKTMSGQAMGTPAYMSPEQCRDAGGVTDRADVYSLGVMLYEVLAGRPPFLAQNFAELAAQHLHQAPRPLQEFDPALPDRLAQLVAGMLAKDPATRPAMAQVADDLDVLLRPTTQPPQTAPPQTASPPPVRARRYVLPLSLGAAVLAIASSIAIYRHHHRPPRPKPPAVAAPISPKPSPAVDARPPLPLAGEGGVRVPLPVLRARALGVLQEGLLAADPLLRRRALMLLGEGRDVRIFSLIQPLLRDDEPSVQAQAAAALQQLRARAAAPALLALLKGREAGRDRRVHAAAAGALAQLGVPPGQEVLRKLLADRGADAGIKRRALLLLAEQGDRKARKLLAADLQKDPVLDEDRVATLGRLSREGDAAARQALRAALGVQKQAPDELQLRVAQALAASEDAEGRALLERAARAEGPHRLLAARLLASLDDPSYFALFTQRFSGAVGPVPERVLAAEGLGACGRPQSAQLLAGVLPREGGPLRLRMAAAGAILQIAASDPELLSQEGLYVAQADLSDPQWMARQQAAAALGDVEPRVAVPLLHRAIRDQQPEVRQTAARALGRTRVRAAVPVLGEALDDRVRGVRREALHSISEVGQHLRQRGERVDDIVGTVAGRLDRVDEQDRVAGVSTLVTLGDTSRRAELSRWLSSRDPEIRRQALLAWSADPQGGPSALLAALTDPVFAVRFTAATQLAERGNDAGAGVLREALSSKGPDALIASGLLRKLGQPTPGEVTLSSASPGAAPGARAQALSAVAHLPQQEAVALLSQGVRDAAAEVRLRAVEAAGEVPELLDSVPVQQLLRGLLQDADQRVRIRAGTLLLRIGRKEPPEPAPQPIRTAPAVPAHRKKLPPAAKPHPVTPEPSITNDRIGLPPKALDGTVEIKK